MAFNQFDPSLGTLSDVQVSVTGNFTFAVTGDPTSNAYDASNDLAVVWGPGFTSQSSGSFSPPGPALPGSNPVPAIPSGDVGVAAATLVHHHPSGGTVDDVDTSTGLTDTAAASEVTDYTGTGTVVLDAESDGSRETLGAGGNWATFSPTQVTVQVCVAYDYSPVPVLPESPLAVLLPISAVVVGSGAFLVARRRRGHLA